MTAATSIGDVHARVRSAILRGELVAGDELSQVRLAQTLGVSRTPLREAMRMLIHEGLIEERPNRKQRIAGVSIADMEALYVERVALEATAIRIAVGRLTPLEIGAMEGLLAQMAHFAAERDYESWEVPHRELHRAFVVHAGPRITDTLTQLSDHAERYRRAHTTRAAGAFADSQAEHRRILDACKARDADAAAAALAEHLASTALGVIGLVEPGHDAAALRIALRAASAPSSNDGGMTAKRGS